MHCVNRFESLSERATDMRARRSQHTRKPFHARIEVEQNRRVHLGT